MKPNKPGQVVKFHTPYPNEDPNQKFVVLEIHFDVENPRATIKELNGGKPLASISTILVEDLEVVEVNTSDLLGNEVIVNKSDNTQASGKVIKIKEEKILLDLTVKESGVETNVWLTIEDNNGREHSGTLFVN